MERLLDLLDEYEAKLKCYLGLHDWHEFYACGTERRICRTCSEQQKIMVHEHKTWISDKW